MKAWPRPDTYAANTPIWQLVIFPADTATGLALLQEAGFIDNQNRIIGRQVLDDRLRARRGAKKAIGAVALGLAFDHADGFEAGECEFPG